MTRSRALEAHFTGVYVAQCARKAERFKSAADVVEDVPTLTDVVAPTSVTLILPWPVTGNHAVKHTRNGGHYRTREYNDYRAQVAFIASQRRAPKFAEPIHVIALFWPPDNRARDLDNGWKSIGDSLQAAGVFVNDSQIHRLELQRMRVRKGAGEVSVTVRAAA